MLSNLKGHAALVTGGSSGIGRAIAVRLAREGADVCVTARRKEVLDDVVKECEALGVRALAVVADAADNAQLTSAADQAFEAFGKLSILVNNAGLSVQTGDSPEQVAKATQVNLIGLMVLSQHCIQYLSKCDRGALIQIGSVAGKKSFPGSLPYCATKWGVVGFSAGLFELPELRENGIKVCTINPGYVNTPMVQKASGLDFEKMIQPEDIAEMVAFIAKFPDNACPTEMTVMPQRSPYTSK